MYWEGLLQISCRLHWNDLLWISSELQWAIRLGDKSILLLFSLLFLSGNSIYLAYYAQDFAWSLLKVKLPYSVKFWRGEILTDTDSSNIWWKLFWWMVTVFHHTPVNAVLFLNNSGYNIDGLAGKRQKRQISPVKILLYTVYSQLLNGDIINIIYLI